MSGDDNSESKAPDEVQDIKELTDEELVEFFRALATCALSYFAKCAHEQCDHCKPFLGAAREAWKQAQKAVLEMNHRKTGRIHSN